MTSARASFGSDGARAPSLSHGSTTPTTWPGGGHPRAFQTRAHGTSSGQITFRASTSTAFVAPATTARRALKRRSSSERSNDADHDPGEAHEPREESRGYAGKHQRDC
jgi:hypothetical protein